MPLLQEQSARGPHHLLIFFAIAFLVVGIGGSTLSFFQQPKLWETFRPSFWSSLVHGFLLRVSKVFTNVVGVMAFITRKMEMDVSTFWELILIFFLMIFDKTFSPQGRKSVNSWPCLPTEARWKNIKKSAWFLGKICRKASPQFRAVLFFRKKKFPIFTNF